VGSRHYSIELPSVTGGGDGFQMWKVAANTWKKQSWPEDKEGSSRLGVGRGAKNSSP